MEDIENMKGQASSRCRRIMNVISHWIFGAATPYNCLVAIEKILSEPASTPGSRPTRS